MSLETKPVLDEHVLQCFLFPDQFEVNVHEFQFSLPLLQLDTFSSLVDGR